MKSDFNEMIITAEKAGKKGGGINAILKLIADVRDFQDKLEIAIEAQDLAENKQTLEEINSTVDGVYDTLFEMAKGGIKSIRKVESLDDEATEEAVEEIREERTPQKAPPVMLNVPQIPKM